MLLADHKGYETLATAVAEKIEHDKDARLAKVSENRRADAEEFLGTRAADQIEAVDEFLHMTLLGKPIKYTIEGDDFGPSHYAAYPAGLFMQEVAAYGPRALRRWGEGKPILPYTVHFKCAASMRARIGMSSLIHSLDENDEAMEALAAMAITAAITDDQYSWTGRLFSWHRGNRKNMRLRLSATELPFMLLYRCPKRWADLDYLDSGGKSLVQALYYDGSHGTRENAERRLSPTFDELGRLLMDGYKPATNRLPDDRKDRIEAVKTMNDRAEAALKALRGEA